jgi:eukaryotic-like serine/threonine-protein kinase
LKPAALVGADARLGGRYRIERRIAGGGMATVWLGEDVELGRPVAVKVLSDVLATDPAYRARFRREATVAARLAHPNLVRVYDFGDDERPYLVMEYVEGPSLADVIDADDALAGEPLARQLLGALDHIHRAGVVHRDVKPGNVLIDGGGTARLTDFGIAQPEDATRITDTGNVIGTLRYMAPEVARGGPATERSDLYSAGVVLAEAAGDRGSATLRGLIDRLRAPKPSDRPASAVAALASLDEPATAPTSLAPTTAATAATEPLAPRHRIEIPLWAVLGGMAALAIVIVAVVLAVAGGGGPAGQRQDGTGSGNGAAAAGPASSRGSRSATAPATTTPATTTQAPPSSQAAPIAPSPKPKSEPKPAKEPKSPKGETPPGLAKKPGGLPPGQIKKEQGGP